VEVDQNAMAVQRSRLAKVPLLSGHSFFLAKRFFVGADCITAAQLTQLIILVGGQAVRFWELEEDPEMNHVVFGQRSKRIGSAKKLEKDMELPVIRAEWILDSIAQFRICERERYVISEESVQKKLKEEKPNVISTRFFCDTNNRQALRALIIVHIESK